jgi:hypothetical protein
MNANDKPLFTDSTSYDPSPLARKSQTWLAPPQQSHCWMIAPALVETPRTSRHLPLLFAITWTGDVLESSTSVVPTCTLPSVAVTSALSAVETVEAVALKTALDWPASTRIEEGTVSAGLLLVS